MILVKKGFIMDCGTHKRALPTPGAEPFGSRTRRPPLRAYSFRVDFEEAVDSGAVMILAKNGSVLWAMAVPSRSGKSVGVIDATWSIDVRLSEAAPWCTSSRLARRS
jgi:hypothetical protein